MPDVPTLWHVYDVHGQDKMTLALGVPYLLDADHAELTLMI